jgi:hypothetical protein
MLDTIYSLMAEETKEGIEARRKLDGELSAVTQRTVTGKPDRATWGRLPHQQAAMKAAQSAAG